MAETPPTGRARRTRQRIVPEHWLKTILKPRWLPPTPLQFMLAVTEAHGRYYEVYDRWCRLQIREARKGRPAGCKSDAVRKLEKALEHRMDDVVWLVGGMLGRYDETTNASATKMMFELLLAAAVREKKVKKKGAT